MRPTEAVSWWCTRWPGEGCAGHDPASATMAPIGGQYRTLAGAAEFGPGRTSRPLSIFTEQQIPIGPETHLKVESIYFFDPPLRS
jgi:hypothetical protein